MEASVFDILQQVWPDWKITNEIGSGTYGSVYKAVRKDYDVESCAAIKIISVPKSQSEINTLQAQGMTIGEIKAYLKSIVNEYINEIRLMIALEGNHNIVDVKDYKVVERRDRLGWEIFIRMELLTPFHSYIRNKKLSESDVIKLGYDICTALEICADKKIIHRDIKPGNILVNDKGDFKLGDFGIARKLENITNGLSQKYTPRYMAPEVVTSPHYDSRVDLYSLGIVLYEQLNKGCIPFQVGKQTHANIENAINRRNAGEAFPAPCEASPAMADLILRACDYNPDLRFASATEMKRALLRVANGTYKMDSRRSVQSSAESCDPTWSARKAPAALDQVSGSTVNTFGTMPKKKSKVPAVIVTVLAVILLVCAGIYAVPRVLDGNDSTDLSETAVETTPESTEHLEFDEEQVASIIAEAEALAAEEDYEGALAKIQAGLATYPKSEEFQKKYEEYTSALNAQVKTDALTIAETLAQTGDYLGAFNTVDQAISTIGEDEELASRAKEYEDAYVANVITQVDTHLENGDFDAANQVVSEALKHFPNNTTMKQQQSRIENSKPQKLWVVCPPYESSGYEERASITMAGTQYTNGFVLDAGYNEAYAIYNLNGKYNTLEFDMGHIDGSQMSNVTFEIYLDGQPVKTIDATAEGLPVHYTIQLDGAKQMKINSTGWFGGYPEYGFVNAVLYPVESYMEQSSQLSSATSLMVACPPYESSGYEERASITMAGTQYTNGFVLDAGYNEAYAIYNLNGKYNTLEFDMGHIDGSQMSNVTFEIYLDGQPVKTIDATAEGLPVHYTIQLDGAKQMKINSTGWFGGYPEYGFINAVLY